MTFLYVAFYIVYMSFAIAGGVFFVKTVVKGIQKPHKWMENTEKKVYDND
jgi:hypothetical protein